MGVMSDPKNNRMMRNIYLTSWNVRGLNNPSKRAKIFSHLHDLQADNLFLQETHIKHTEALKLKCSWIGQIFQSTFSAKARGVAILIKKNIPFQHISTKTDPNGRFIIVTGTILTVHVTLLNLYAPNFNNPIFFVWCFSSSTRLNNNQLDRRC